MQMLLKAFKFLALKIIFLTSSRAFLCLLCLPLVCRGAISPHNRRERECLCVFVMCVCVSECEIKRIHIYFERGIMILYNIYCIYIIVYYAILYYTIIISTWKTIKTTPYHISFLVLSFLLLFKLCWIKIDYHNKTL